MLTTQSPAEGSTSATSAPAAATRAPSPPFRLVDGYQAQYLKFSRREPRTLEELAIARANYQHERRLAEIRAMAKKLALFDAFLPALAQRGLKFCYRDITTSDSGKTLRIQTETFSLQDNRLYQALISLGFREIERKSYSERSAHEQVTLKHGRALLVTIDVTKTPTAREVEAATAERAP